MSISQNFPDEGPSLNLNFAGSRKLDPRITFTRSSSATFVDENGLVVNASNNIPRFEHSYNGTEIQSLGLLVEESRTNLVTYSGISTSNWSNNLSAVLTANSGTSPDGTTTATQIAAPATIGSGVFQIFSLTSGTAYTYSLFVKAVSGSNVIYFGSDIGTNTTVQVNTSTGVASTTAGSPSNIITTKYPNNWYRVSFTFIATATALHSFVIYNLTANATTWLAWGAQVEAGAFSTSYIPTVESTVTRSADNASMTGTNFTSWNNQSEGTYITSAEYDGTPILGSVNRTVFSGYSGSNVVYWNVLLESTNTVGFVVEDPPLTYLAVLNSGSQLSIGDRRKTASAYKANDYSFTADGATPSTDISGTITSTATTLYIGNLAGSTWYLNGIISQILYYPKRLTNDQLQNLTK